MGIVAFNGISTTDLGLVVQAPPVYEFPERNVEMKRIPGRNGDVVIDKGSFNNVNRTYYFAVAFKSNKEFMNYANSIRNWLHSAKGYARLEDSYDSEVYRMAMYREEGQMADLYGQATAMTVNFECKPQRYLKDGDNPQQIQNGLKINLENNYYYDANPEFYIVPSGNSVTITVTNSEGTNTMELLGVNSSDKIIIDTENQECYFENISYNSKLILRNGKFPSLKALETSEVTITGISEATIKPRWWML